MMEWGVLVEGKAEFKAAKFVQEKVDWAPGNSITVASSSLD